MANQKSGKKKGFGTTIRMHSGVLRVPRGSSGARRAPRSRVDLCPSLRGYSAGFILKRCEPAKDRPVKKKRRGQARPTQSMMHIPF